MPDEPQKPCPLCAGTGKVRDYQETITANVANTFFTIDTAVMDKYNIYPICGT